MFCARRAAFPSTSLPYRDVRRGDIIVFRYPVDIKQDYVKRAIGMPGDRIRLVNKQLILNGHAVNEPYVQHIIRLHRFLSRQLSLPPPEPVVMPPAQDMLTDHVVNGEVVVPPGCVFAMGDNRDDSLDSRYWGFVPRENIEGTPLVIYWSFEAPTADLDERQHRRRPHHGRHHPLLHQDPLVADVQAGPRLSAAVTRWDAPSGSCPNCTCPGRKLSECIALAKAYE